MTTPMSEVQADIQAEVERAEMLTIRALAYLGEKCVIEAKHRPQNESWIDRTGNLRSSIGYVIYHKGRLVQEFGFTGKGALTNKRLEGKTIGKDFAEKIAKSLDGEFALVVVAGMNYAEYVEAMDNKVVLASAELLARKELSSMMQKLKTQIAK